MPAGNLPQRPSPLLPFLAGVGAGLLAAASMVAGAVGHVKQEGVTVRVDGPQIIAQVKGEIEAAVAREVNAHLDRVQRDLPGRVAREAAERVRSTPLQLGGMQVQIPPTVAAEVGGRVETAVGQGLQAALSQVDARGLSQRLGEAAAEMVSRHISRTLEQQRLSVQVGPGVTIPIRVVVSSLP
jgi:triphosphoribosyl-dephospho-CoA synthetase